MRLSLPALSVLAFSALFLSSLVFSHPASAETAYTGSFNSQLFSRQTAARGTSSIGPLPKDFVVAIVNATEGTMYQIVSLTEGSATVRVIHYNPNTTGDCQNLSFNSHDCVTAFNEATQYASFKIPATQQTYTLKVGESLPTITGYNMGIKDGVSVNGTYTLTLKSVGYTGSTANGQPVPGSYMAANFDAVGDIGQVTTVSTAPSAAASSALAQLNSLDKNDLKYVLESLQTVVEVKKDILQRQASDAVAAAVPAVTAADTSTVTAPRTQTTATAAVTTTNATPASGNYGSYTNYVNQIMSLQSQLVKQIGSGQATSTANMTALASLSQQLLQLQGNLSSTGGRTTSGSTGGVGGSTGGDGGDNYDPYSSGGSSSEWTVCDGCTKGPYYLSYYDKDGKYHSGMSYDDPSRSFGYTKPDGDNPIPGTQFAWRDCVGRSSDFYDFCGLRIYDPEGIALTTVNFDPESILAAAKRFGIPAEDLQDQLNTMADYFDKQGIDYEPYDLIAGGPVGGYSSDHGIDLRDLANGGLGTAYDWRFDGNCEQKGPYACQQTEEARKLADDYGLKPTDVTTGPTVEQVETTCEEVTDQTTADVLREMYGRDQAGGGFGLSAAHWAGSTASCTWLNQPVGTPL